MCPADGRVDSDGWPERAIVASVVPCQPPMKETMRRLPVAAQDSRWAASLASEPESPNQTFFSKVAGHELDQAAPPGRQPGD